MNLRFHASKVVFKFLKRSKWLQSHSNRHPSWENASSCEVPTLDETWQCQLQQLQIRLDITLNMLPYHWAGSLCHGFLNIADMFLSRPLNRWLGIPISLVYPKKGDIIWSFIRSRVASWEDLDMRAHMNKTSTPSFSGVSIPTGCGCRFHWPFNLPNVAKKQKDLVQINPHGQC